MLWAVQKGYLDEVDVEKVKEYQNSLAEFLTTRHAELLEQLTHKLVFPVGRVVRQITRHQYRVWSIWQAADRLDGGPQSRHRIGISPSSPDVGIAQLDK